MRTLWTCFSEDEVTTLGALVIINTFQSSNIRRGSMSLKLVPFFPRLNHNLVSHPTLYSGNGLFLFNKSD